MEQPTSDVEQVSNEAVRAALMDKQGSASVAPPFANRLGLRPVEGSVREHLQAGHRSIRRKPPSIKSLNDGQLDRLVERNSALMADLAGVEKNIKITDDDIAELDAEYRRKRGPMIAQRKVLMSDADRIDEAIYETEYSIAKLEQHERRRRRGA